MEFRPFLHLHKILTARQHPTEPQDDNVDQRVFEILPLAAGVGNCLQPFHEGTRHRGHIHPSSLHKIGAALSILTPSFYKSPSAFAVPLRGTREPAASLATAVKVLAGVQAP